MKNIIRMFRILLVVVAFLGNAAAVRVDVDTSRARHLANFGNNVKSTLERWYPYLSYQLYSPTFENVDVISVYFDPNYKGVAYASGKRIVGSVDYYTKNQNGVGSMIHEMVHVIQQYRNSPFWVTEGMADYYRYYHYKDNQIGKPGSKNKHTDGYSVTAYFFNWVDKNKAKIAGRSMLYWVNKDAREGNYKDTIWPRLLGQTVEQLWQEMMQKA